MVLSLSPWWERFMYAVLETGSKQYRVAKGDTLQVERPTVANATVVADVVEHIRGEKKIAFKMKRRKGYHKTIGHRQELTVVKIKEIQTGAGSAETQKAESEKAESEKAESEKAESEKAESEKAESGKGQTPEGERPADPQLSTPQPSI